MTPCNEMSRSDVARRVLLLCYQAVHVNALLYSILLRETVKRPSVALSPTDHRVPPPLSNSRIMNTVPAVICVHRTCTNIMLVHKLCDAQKDAGLRFERKEIGRPDRMLMYQGKVLHIV